MSKKIEDALGLGHYDKEEVPKTRSRNIRKAANIKKRYMQGTDILEQEVIRLRREGKSFRQIADELKLATPGSAHRIFTRVMERDYEITKEAANAHREEQLHLLDEQLGALLVRQQVDPENLQVVDRILKVLERKSKLIGLDAAIKTETNITMLSHEQALEQLDQLNNDE